MRSIAVVGSRQMWLSALIRGIVMSKNKLLSRCSMGRRQQAMSVGFLMGDHAPSGVHHCRTLNAAASNLNVGLGRAHVRMAQ